MFLARQTTGQRPYVYAVERMYGDCRVWTWDTEKFGSGISAIAHTPQQALNLLEGRAAPEPLEITQADVEGAAHNHEYVKLC